MWSISRHSKGSMYSSLRPGWRACFRSRKWGALQIFNFFDNKIVSHMQTSVREASQSQEKGKWTHQPQQASSLLSEILNGVPTRHEDSILNVLGLRICHFQFIVEFGARSFAEPPYKISKELFVVCVFIRNRFYLSAVKLHCIVCRKGFGHPLLEKQAFTKNLVYSCRNRQEQTLSMPLSTI